MTLLIKQRIFLNTILLLSLLYIKKCCGGCYFPSELQGLYLTQSTITENQIQYSEVNITGDSIPIWGLCHKRVGNNVILSSEETECYRCFNLKMVAKNILRVITTEPDFMSKCYTNEDKALASCPPSEILMHSASNYTKIIHYKYLDLDGREIRYEYCPIDGRYKFDYNNDDGREDIMECKSRTSELDNCPSGSSINLRFKECSVKNHEIRFECLGHWIDLDGRNYLALVNNQLHFNSYRTANRKEYLKPQYRCAIFDKDPQTGSVTIYFSKDSTCTITTGPIKSSTQNKSDTIMKIKNKLHNNGNILNDGPISIDFHQSPTISYSNDQSGSEYSLSTTNSETIILYPSVNLDKTYWSRYEHYCKFPEWLQGEWQHISVKNDTFIFRDQISFKSYTMKCIQNNLKIDDTVLVYTRTQCDEESYKCLKIKNRNSNVIEFQIGVKSASNLDSTLCLNEYFDDTKWLTQGRLNEIYTPCPVNGILEGMIPDADNYCARLSSECSSLDVMNYEVSVCNLEVLEERKYRCLGQWNENNVIFTYTRRLDIGTYECFIGASKHNDTTIFIKEAGEHCQRDIDPFKYGMELKQIEPCSLLDRHQSTPVSFSIDDNEDYLENNNSTILKALIYSANNAISLTTTEQPVHLLMIPPSMLPKRTQVINMSTSQQHDYYQSESINNNGNKNVSSITYYSSSSSSSSQSSQNITTSTESLTTNQNPSVSSTKYQQNNNSAEKSKAITLLSLSKIWHIIGLIFINYFIL